MQFALYKPGESLATLRAMARRSKPRYPMPHGEPHHWAYLSDWREMNKLTQEGVAELLLTTGATVSRWERGDSALNGAQYAKLAALYGAADVGMLSLPPPSRDDIAAVREAFLLLRNMSPERRADWLGQGRVLSEVSSAERKSRET